MNEQSEKKRKVSGTAINDEILAAMAEFRTLRDWSSVTEEVTLPPELAAAFATGRPELIKLAQPRALTEEECKAVYHAMAVFILTNQALQGHAQRVAHLANLWTDHIKGVVHVAAQIEHFAAFRASTDKLSEENEG